MRCQYEKKTKNPKEFLNSLKKQSYSARLEEQMHEEATTKMIFQAADKKAQGQTAHSRSL